MNVVAIGKLFFFSWLEPRQCRTEMKKVFFLSWSICCTSSAEIKTYFCHNHHVVNVIAISNRGKSNFFSLSRCSECSSAEIKKYTFLSWSRRSGRSSNVFLTKNFSGVLHYLLPWKQVRNNHEILILIELWRKTKQWHKEYEKYQLCTQSREAFHKKLFFKSSQYSQENNCVGVLQACNFIKRRLQHSCFLDKEKFLRTAILKNICERLFLRIFPIMLFSYLNK